MKYYQRAEHDKRFFLAMAPFRRLVREIAQDTSNNGIRETKDNVRFTVPALEAIQVASEAFIVSLMECKCICVGIRQGIRLTVA